MRAADGVDGWAALKIDDNFTLQLAVESGKRKVLSNLP
jgi:hypothetical protein